jgi:hypothetical protein
MSQGLVDDWEGTHGQKPRDSDDAIRLRYAFNKGHAFGRARSSRRKLWVELTAAFILITSALVLFLMGRPFASSVALGAATYSVGVVFGILLGRGKGAEYGR